MAMLDTKVGLTGAPNPGNGDSVNTALSTPLTSFDYLMYRIEATTRDNAIGVMVLILDSTPDWERFRTCFDNLSRRFVRLRQKVVVPTLPTASPRWVVDPDFNLDFHVRRMGVPQHTTLRELLGLADVSLQTPMDMSRPLWMATLVEGLPEGKAAAFLSCSHALTDGVGTVEMLSLLYDLERDPPAEPAPPQPISENLSANDLMWAGINELPRGVRDALTGIGSMVGRVVREPGSALAGAVGYARSSVRVLRQAAEPSPLLKGRSLATRCEAIEVRLSDLHTAARAGGGTINEAYVAAISGAFRRYHQALGMPIDMLAMTVAVNLRGEADLAGTNRFIIANVAAPVGTADPAARMTKIRTQITRCREEPARSVAHALAHFAHVLPGRLVAALTESAQGADLQTSNWASFPCETYLAGAKVLREYNVGPLPDLPMMAVLISRDGVCTITVRYDKAAIVDEELFARCLLEGFDEILALAGEPAAHAVPGSFTAESFDLSTRSASGS